MVLALTFLAGAAVPGDVRPVVSPMDVQAQVERWRADHGQAPATLACTPLWPGEAQLCFRRSGAVSYVTRDDLERWRVDVDDLIAELKTRSEPLVGSQLLAVDIEGMPSQYWIATGAEGWAAALVLHPDVVAARIGAPVLFAAPADGIVIVWRGGDAATDKVVTVGVKEIHATRPGSISPVVHRWTGTGWSPWAEAVKAAEQAP